MGGFDFSSGEGAFVLIAGVIGFIVLAFMATKRRLLTVPMGAMLFASCLGVPLNPNGTMIRTVWLPLQTERSGLFLMFGIALGMHTVFHLRGIVGKFPSAQAFGVMLMGYYAALLRFAHVSPADSMLSMLYASATLLPLWLAVPILMDAFEDAFRILRMISAVNLLWILGVAVQVGVNPQGVVVGREQRFVGLLANPQHAGCLVAVFLAVSLYLFLNDSHKRVRLANLVLVGANVILLAWSGSRTGLGMAVLGVTGVLYARVGRAILWLPAMAIAAVIMFKILEVLGIEVGFARLASTENTRASAWNTLYQRGLDSPVIGNGVQGAGDSENGYLYGFASYGVGMILLIFTLIAISAFTSLKLWARRKYLPVQYKALADMLIAYNAVYFGGSFFEGYMMARVAANLTFFMIFAGMASALIQLTDRHVRAARLAPPEDEHAEPYGMDPHPAV